MTHAQRIRSEPWLANAILRAFVLSLLAHVCVIGSLELATQLGLWKHGGLISWIRTELLKQPVPPEELQAIQTSPTAAQREKEAPLLFVDVDPSLATEESPKDAKYYSALNTRAANPIPAESDAPKVGGEQTRIVRTTDVPRSQPQPLQPAVQPAREADKEIAEEKPRPLPKPAAPPGDLAMAKPTNERELSERKEVKDPGDAPEAVAPARPRRLADVKKSGIAGQKMKQEGGVKQYALDTSLNVKATPFGAYDAAIVAAIQHRWYTLLDENEFARDRTGKVVLDFHLNYDGRVTELKVNDNTVGEVLSAICQRAVLDPSPYAAWPADMRRLVGANFREVRFTFYYN